MSSLSSVSEHAPALDVTQMGALDDTMSATSSDGGRSCAEEFTGRGTLVHTSDARVSALKALAGIKNIVSKSREIDAEALQHIREQRARAKTAQAASNPVGRPFANIPNSAPSMMNNGPPSHTKQFLVTGQDACQLGTSFGVADVGNMYSSSPATSLRQKSGAAANFSTSHIDTSASSLLAPVTLRSHQPTSAALSIGAQQQHTVPQSRSPCSSESYSEPKYVHISLDQTPPTPSVPNTFCTLAKKPLATSFPCIEAPLPGSSAAGKLLQEAVTVIDQEGVGRASAALPPALVNSVLNLSLPQLHSLRAVLDSVIQQQFATLAQQASAAPQLSPLHPAMTVAQQTEQSLLQQMRRAQNVQQTAAILHSLSMGAASRGDSSTQNRSSNYGSGLPGDYPPQTSRITSVAQQQQSMGLLNRHSGGTSVHTSSLDRTSPTSQLHAGLGMSNLDERVNPGLGAQGCWDDQAGTHQDLRFRRAFSLPPVADNCPPEATSHSNERTGLDNNDLAFMFQSLNMGTLPSWEEGSNPAETGLHSFSAQQAQQLADLLLVDPSSVNQQFEQLQQQLPQEHLAGAAAESLQQHVSLKHSTGGHHPGLFPSS